jgi:predicted TPR repeat methyltransferase
MRCPPNSTIPPQITRLPLCFRIICSMYEKNGEFDKALNDITVVLALDPMHVRARTRKARIHEAQGKLTEALEEYVLVMFDHDRQGG